MALQRSIETDDGEFQFSQMERQTSCTADDRTRFQVDTGDTGAETDPTLPTMDDILKSKRHATWPCSQRDMIDDDDDNDGSVQYNVDSDKTDADIFNCTEGDIFASGVNNLINFSVLGGGDEDDVEKKVED